MGMVSHYLGIAFCCQVHKCGAITVHLSQSAYIDLLLERFYLQHCKHATTPYRMGLPIDMIPHQHLDMTTKTHLTKDIWCIVGPLNWLALVTWPDISTTVSLLAQHQNDPSHRHLQAAKYVLQYLKSSRDYCISYSSFPNQSSLESFINFPLNPSQITSFADANWDPQDQTIPTPNKIPPELHPFTVCSVSGNLSSILGGHLEWQSGRQKLTARSSTEAEIYATDQCTKKLLQLLHILTDINRLDILPLPTNIFCDNSSCVQCSKNTTTKSLRHTTIREIAVRESAINNIIKVLKIDGRLNPSDIFTNEFKDQKHFLNLRDSILTLLPKTIISYPSNLSAPIAYKINSLI
uniref:Reverse transcriptase Ty1/copia-type domain-containing protein n=1 Tax=Corethron hystrix TaxID=216773 RepID=A0A6U5M3S4_9STRA|mmetsp:Transcript_8398/g.18421  ORF Transcript_8398/g.18421 Transcript_8398/m.18421 type:complete len:350 (+) Transcript_8398:689-1738(+)